MIGKHWSRGNDAYIKQENDGRDTNRRRILILN